MWKSDWAAVPGVPGKFFSVGSNGAASGSAKYGSSYTLDYGATWTHIDTGVQYICVEFYNDMVGWAGGFSINATTSGIFKWDATSSVIPIHENTFVNIYPNPASTIININSDEEIRNIIIYNQLGQEISEYNINNNYYALSLNSYQKGLYLMKINTNKGTNIYKFIVE